MNNIPVSKIEILRYTAYSGSPEKRSLYRSFTFANSRHTTCETMVSLVSQRNLDGTTQRFYRVAIGDVKFSTTKGIPYSELDIENNYGWFDTGIYGCGLVRSVTRVGACVWCCVVTLWPDIARTTTEFSSEDAHHVFRTDC